MLLEAIDMALHCPCPHALYSFPLLPPVVPKGLFSVGTSLQKTTVDNLILS